MPNLPIHITERELNFALQNGEKILNKLSASDYRYGYSLGVTCGLKWAFKGLTAPYTNIPTSCKELRYDIWREGHSGYDISHKYGKTELLTSGMLADSFKEACMAYANLQYTAGKECRFNLRRLSIMGCKLFDNEIDAMRKTK